MPKPSRLLTAFTLSALLLAPPPARAVGIDINIDVGNPMDLLDNVQNKPGPKPKPKPAPVVKTTAILPPKAEKRLLQNEVLVETKPDIAPAALTAIAARNHLELVETADVTLLASKVHRFRIVDGRPVRTVLAGLGRERDVLLAQANYSYALLEGATPPAPSTPPPANAAPQYTIDQLHLTEAHAIATGNAVRVGILDTALAPSDTELGGSITASFDAAGEPAGDDVSHGTALAGIIAAHGQLTGVAPKALLLSARAFVSSEGHAPSSNSFFLLKGLDWLASSGAQVVNMSFAGPSDTLFLKEVKAAHDKGIVLVAAAGNDGPKAAPEFPAADASTMGVTAIDDADAILAAANQGDYVAIAAPGVDVLVLSPEGSFNVSSGTSMAAAHVSGAAALLLERNPALTPDAIEKLLMSTALDLGRKGRDRTFGAGLVEPDKALETASPGAAVAH